MIRIIINILALNIFASTQNEWEAKMCWVSIYMIDKFYYFYKGSFTFEILIYSHIDPNYLTNDIVVCYKLTLANKSFLRKLLL